MRRTKKAKPENTDKRDLRKKDTVPEGIMRRLKKVKDADRELENAVNSGDYYGVKKALADGADPGRRLENGKYLTWVSHDLGDHNICKVLMQELNRE